MYHLDVGKTRCHIKVILLFLLIQRVMREKNLALNGDFISRNNLTSFEYFKHFNNNPCKSQECIDIWKCNMKCAINLQKYKSKMDITFHLKKLNAPVLASQGLLTLSVFFFHKDPCHLKVLLIVFLSFFIALLFYYKWVDMYNTMGF